MLRDVVDGSPFSKSGVGPTEPEASPRLSRRDVMMATLVATLGMALSPADAQVVDPHPPTIDISDPQEVADGVFVLRDRRIWLVPNIGIVVGRDSALVVDSSLGTGNGERVLDAARRLAGPNRRLFLTTTHFHPEHATGATVFRRDATIVMNAVQRDETVAERSLYLDLFRQTQSPAAVAALIGAQVTMPHVVFDGSSTTLDLGDRLVELHSTGTAHTRGDLVVNLPKERILFAGDLIEERMFPIFPWFPPNDVDVDAARWTQALRGFRSLDPRLIVPGHGDPGGMPIALALADQIDRAGCLVRQMRASGISAADLAKTAKETLTAAQPRWEHPDLLDWQIAYFAAQTN